MNIYFKSQILFDLYEGRGATNKQYRSIPGVIKKYQGVVGIIKIIEKISDLYSYPGLHYEKLKGNLNIYIVLLD